VRDRADAVAGVVEPAAGSERGTLLGVRDDDGAQFGALPAGSWSYDTDTAPAAMRSKLLP